MEENKIEENTWILSSERLPEYGDYVEGTDDKIEINRHMMYASERVCMMAGIAGGNGYFKEGFATDGTHCEPGLIEDTPKYWRLQS